MSSGIEATQACRFPLLGAAGEAMLKRLLEHPHAPRFHNASGHRLSAADLALVLRQQAAILAAPAPWAAPRKPPWLTKHLAVCKAEVPYWQGLQTSEFARIPTTHRGLLSQAVWQFVPQHLPLDRLLRFETSGTTGHPLMIPSHATVAAGYLALHRRALRHFGVQLSAGQGEVAAALVGYQQRCFTYASVTPAMDEAGLVKLNLHPDDWREPDDRQRYLDDLKPEVISGDPISLAALAALPLQHRPRALLSTSMHLSQGLREQLQARFGCAVVDLYSMNEAGPIAFYDPAAGGHRLLQPGLYVELLGAADEPVAEGERGEITLTGGFNPWLPLLRYRTGDYASLVHTATGPVLRDLAGRPPVQYRTTAGVLLNNVDVTHALGALALSQYGLHQGADGALRLKLPPAQTALADAATAALRGLFGDAQVIRVQALQAEGKVVQYSTDLP